MVEKNILEITNLKKYFPAGHGKVLKAVNGVSFSIKKGETFGLVGESGSGKTTTGRALLRLYEPTGGEVIFDGLNLKNAGKKQWKELKQRMQMIFQNYHSSLNPRMTVREIVSEGMDIHELYRGEEKKERIAELLKSVGLNSGHGDRFPHELSGGQKQRVCIARSLAVKPDFIVCDEPTSALDVSVQAQVINLLLKLQKELDLTYLFISHDLTIVKHLSDRIGVMYLGKLVEIAESEALYKTPRHPYTKVLLSSVSVPDPKTEHGKEREKINGEMPNPMDPPSGCAFVTRCTLKKEICTIEEPFLTDLGNGHLCACHLI